MNPIRIARVESESRRGSLDFDALFREQFGYVWHSLRRLGVAERDLEDLTQQIFLDVYRKLDTFHPNQPVRPWLFGFALRVASNYRRLARHVWELFRPADAPA